MNRSYIKLPKIRNAEWSDFYGENDHIMKYIVNYDDIIYWTKVRKMSLKLIFISFVILGQLDKCKLLIEYCRQYNITFNTRDTFEEAFCYSARYGHIDIVKWLVQYTNSITMSIDIHSMDNYALIYSYQFRYFEIAKWLINYAKSIGEPYGNKFKFYTKLCE